MPVARNCGDMWQESPGQVLGVMPLARCRVERVAVVADAEWSIVAGYVDELHNVRQGNSAGAGDLLQPELCPAECQCVPILLGLILKEPPGWTIAQLLRHLQTRDALALERVGLDQGLTDEQHSSLIQHRATLRAATGSRQTLQPVNTSRDANLQQHRLTMRPGKKHGTHQIRFIVRTEPTNTSGRQAVAQLNRADRTRIKAQQPPIMGDDEQVVWGRRRCRNGLADRIGNPERKRMRLKDSRQLEIEDLLRPSSGPGIGLQDFIQIELRRRHLPALVLGMPAQAKLAIPRDRRQIEPLSSMMLQSVAEFRIVECVGGGDQDRCRALGFCVNHRKKRGKSLAWMQRGLQSSQMLDQPVTTQQIDGEELSAGCAKDLRVAGLAGGGNQRQCDRGGEDAWHAPQTQSRVQQQGAAFRPAAAAVFHAADTAVRSRPGAL